MKVKEVEVFNTVFQVEGNVLPSPDDTISAYLSNNGLTMSVKVDAEIKTGYARRISVAFMVIDYKTNTYSDVELGTSDPITVYTPGEVFDVALDPVLTLATSIPQNTSGSSSEVYIEPLTYGANIERSWGLESLSYPYRIHSTGDLVYPESTDGWYRVTILDVPIWNGTDEYAASDIAYHTPTQTYAIANTDNVSTEPLNPDETWRAADANDWRIYSIAITRLSDQDASFRVLSDMLVTRNLKHRYIFECIKATSFDNNDNKAADYTLSMIIALREVSVAYLESGDPIKAVQAIKQVPIEYEAFTKPNIASVPDNNYTL